MIVIGVLSVFFQGEFGGLWWIVLGWFLYQAAGAALGRMAIDVGLEGVTAAQVMTRPPVAVDGDLTLQQVFDEHFMKQNVPSFPVLIAGRVRGLIMLKQMGEIPRARWSTVKVSDLMQVLHPEDAVDPATPAAELLGRLQDGGKRVVVVEDGTLVGIVSAGDITRWLQRQSLS